MKGIFNRFSLCNGKARDSQRLLRILAKTLFYGFGELDGRYFHEPWNRTVVAAYVQKLLGPDRVIRVSAFPNTISCHARSELIDPKISDEGLDSFLDGFDPSTTLNVFPQQSADQMCFRLACNSGRVLVEAGWGQAMYVFEAQRGQHPTIIAKGDLDQIELTSTEGASEALSIALRSFLNEHEDWIQSVSTWLPIWLAVDQIAIEGYYDPKSKRLPVVVDIDLPLDLAWN